MNLEIFPDPLSTAAAAARFLAAECRAAVNARQRFILALSGGQTPWLMLASLVREEMPWNSIQILQTDERVAPTGDEARNLTRLQQILTGTGPLRPHQIHAMPVGFRDLDAGAQQYAETIAEIAGTPPIIDVVHLGLGADGHTASLTPGDAALDVIDSDVAVTGVYQGNRRMTLTYPILNRARRILWLVTGKEKAPTLARLQSEDLSIPAGRVRTDTAIVFAEAAGDHRMGAR